MLRVRFDYYFICGRGGTSAALSAVFIGARKQQKQCARKTKIEVWRAKNERTNGEWPGHSLADHCVCVRPHHVTKVNKCQKHTLCPAVRDGERERELHNKLFRLKVARFLYNWTLTQSRFQIQLFAQEINTRTWDKLIGSVRGLERTQCTPGM